MKGQKEKRDQKTKHRTESKWTEIDCEIIVEEEVVMTSEEKAKEILEHHLNTEPRWYN